MQVLGMIPKKFKKKKEGDKCLVPGLSKESKARDLKHDVTFEADCKTEKKSNHITKNNHHHHKHSKHSHSTNKKAHSKVGKQITETIMPPLRWNPYGHMWKKLLDRRKGKRSKTGNICYSSVEAFKKDKAECEEQSKDLFKSYSKCFDTFFCLLYFSF